MPISIGIITARQSLDNIRSVDQKMRRHCKITYLPYSTLPELCSLYLKNIRKFDGILFSGPIPRDYILENVSSITRPYRCTDLKDRDYYLAIARLFASKPGLDFSRVYFDTGVEPAIINNVFYNGNGPYLPAKYTPLEYKVFLRSSIYERSMNTYRSLWNEKKYDIFITRFTNLASQLEAEHIPHVFLQPSPETIMDYFHALLGDIKESIIQNSLTACCIVDLPEPSRSQANYDRLEKLLVNFNGNHNRSMLIRRNGSHFEVTTSSMEAREITSKYTSCQLSNELNKNISFPIQIGWGISFDIVSAYKNAKKALLACQKDHHHFTYLVTESQEMVGPLNSNRSIIYDLQPDAHIFALAKSLGIAPVNLEKLISLQKSRNMYEFTSSDLVYFLEITPRSASRILLKLSDGGLARPVRSVNLSGTGRSSTVYELDFSTIGS